MRFFVVGVKQHAINLGDKEIDRFIYYLSGLFLDRRTLLSGGLSNHYKVSQKSHADEVMEIYQTGKLMVL